MSRRLLLVGAGHAHLHLLERADRLRAEGWEVTLVAPAQFRYSGTAAAVATGALPASAGVVDVRALAAAMGVVHLVDRLADLDVEARRGRTRDGREVAFDVVSLNLGSTTRPLPGAQGPGEALAVKPLEALAGLDARLRAAAGARVTVLGTGASGVELAAASAAHPTAPRVVLLGEGRPGAGLPTRAAARVVRRLADLGVEVPPPGRVASVRAGAVVLEDGREVGHDLLVLATGLVAPPEVAAWGLGDDDGVPVGATLQHPDHPHVLAAGDCARFLPRPLPRTGVHGVRQGPVLLAGLLARAAGQEPPAYRPQRRALAVLDLAQGRGLAVRGGWWWEGRAAHRLKRAVDRRWLRRYQR